MSVSFLPTQKLKEEEKEENYRRTKGILEQLMEKCVERTPEGVVPCRHKQLLLKNMGAHAVVLELLRVHYDKVCSICVGMERADLSRWSVS